MILSLRDKLQGTVAFIVVGIVAVPMALFGVESLFMRGGAEDGVAKVNKVAITDTQLQQAVAVQKQQILNRMEGIDPALIDDEQLRAPVLQQLIGQEALRQKALDNGVGVAPQLVQMALRDEEAFQTDGRFDRGRFEFVIRQMGYTPAGYLELLKGELVNQQVYQALAYSEFAAAHELEATVQMLAEERDFRYIHIPAELAAESLSVEEGALQTYYEEHADRYVEPEKLVLEVIELSLADIAETVELDEAEIERFFEEEQAQVPDQSGWEVAHILLSDPAAAADDLATIRERLAAGDDFAELAAEFSDDSGSARQGGLLGFGGKDDFPPEFVAALAKMEPGDSESVETASGVHLVKLLAVSEDSEAPQFEEERERIAAELRQLKAQEKMVDLVDRLREQAYNAVALRDVAEDLDVPYRLSDPISRDAPANGVEGHPRVVSAAYSQDVYEDGFASEVMELASGQVVVVKIEEKIPARQLTFSEVRQQVEEEWRQAQVRDRLMAMGNEVLESLEAGADEAGEELSELGIDWQAATAVTRGDSGVPAEIQAFAFGLPQGASAPVGQLLPGDGFAIVVLDEIRPGSMEAVPAGELAQLRGQLINDHASRAIDTVQALAAEQAKVVLQ